MYVYVIINFFLIQSLHDIFYIPKSFLIVHEIFLAQKLRKIKYDIIYQTMLTLFIVGALDNLLSSNTQYKITRLILVQSLYYNSLKFSLSQRTLSKCQKIQSLHTTHYHYTHTNCMLIFFKFQILFNPMYQMSSFL